MNFLQTILAAKREEIAARKRTVLRSRLEDMPKYELPRRSLRSALERRELGVIAEVRKAAPSRGVMKSHFDPLAIARRFVQAGANAVSVLTDEHFFQGRLEFIERMRNFIDVPILRKDFILDSYQLHEARAFGADAVLLMAAALPPGQLADLAAEAAELGLDALVEVHQEDELEELDAARPSLIGVNNRDLMTFETDLMTSVRLRRRIPQDVQVVSEGGIAGAEDVRLLLRHGIHAVLIGDLFMQAEDPGKALQDLVTGALS